MNKTIGIMTYPDIAEGKGRFLQAYALYSAIKSFGYEVEIIDYRRKNEETKLQRLLRHIKMVSLKEVLEYLYVKKECKKMSVIREERKQQRLEYESFIERNINMSPLIEDIDTLSKYAEKFDAIVCGSDQIWNPYYWGKDKAYYANFVDEKKRIAYAASIGTTDVDNDNLKMIGNLIRQMNVISVREESARDMLRKECDIEAKVVVDPTFLMSSEWWNQYADENNVREGKYILTFFFDNGVTCRKFANKLSDKYDLPIINIPETSMDLNKGNEIYPCLGPKKFATLFKKAEYIVTQSFHGVVLSILFRKKFFVLDRETNYAVSGLITRISDMLKRFNLEERIVKGTEELSIIDKDIDYNEKYEIINKWADECRDFLQNVIEEVVSCK